jgi:chloramphenicol 3-O-phosphotransferase
MTPRDTKPGPRIVWLNGTHDAGKTTTSAIVQKLFPGFPGVRRRDGR